LVLLPAKKKIFSCLTVGKVVTKLLERNYETAQGVFDTKISITDPMIFVSSVELWVRA